MKMVMMVEQERKFPGKRDGFTGMIKRFYSSLSDSINTGVYNFKTHEMKNLVSCMLFHINFISTKGPVHEIHAGGGE